MIPGTFSTIKSTEVLPVSYIGNAGKYVGVSGTGVTVTFHEDTAAGDLLLLYVQCDNDATISTPSGWTRIHTGTVESRCRGSVYYKFYNTGDTTTVFVQQSRVQVVASVLTFRNVKNPSPINKSLGTAVAGSSGSVRTMPGVTTTKDNCMVLYAGFHDEDDDSPMVHSWTNANIVSGTEFIDISTKANWDGGFAVWGGYLPVAGASGGTTATFTASGHNIEGRGIWSSCVALEPLG